jgi:hypothetical protein
MISSSLGDVIKPNLIDWVGICIDNNLWPWLRKVERTGDDDRYFISSSIMEIFSYKLPDLTLKKLSEITGFQYTSVDGKKKISCTKKGLDNFLTGLK